MRHLTFLALLTLCLAGCSDSAPVPGPADAEWRDRDQDEAQQTRRKEAYREEIRAKLSVLEQQLADLRARAETAGERLRARLEPHIETVQRNIQAAERHLQELRDDSAAAWRAARPKLEEALGNLREAFRKAADEFRR